MLKQKMSTACAHLAEAAHDHDAIADLLLLHAAPPVEQGQINEAAMAAREAALQAVAPMLYVSAALTIAQRAEARGDRVDAYEALARGWATLGDLLGPDTARATFVPQLERL